MKKESNRFSHKKRKTKKETSNKFESPFSFPLRREGLINPSLRCREPPCKKEKRMKAFK